MSKARKKALEAFTKKTTLSTFEVPIPKELEEKWKKAVRQNGRRKEKERRVKTASFP